MKRPIYDNPSVSPAMDFLTTEGDYDEYDIRRYIARNNQKNNKAEVKLPSCTGATSNITKVEKGLLGLALFLIVASTLVILCL